MEELKEITKQLERKNDMRRMTRCMGCGKLVGVYKSYKAHVKDRRKSLLTGGMKEVEYTGRICKDCAIKGGYKNRKSGKKVKK